jgi:hypothetical protein
MASLKFFHSHLDIKVNSEAIPLILFDNFKEEKNLESESFSAEKKVPVRTG